MTAAELVKAFLERKIMAQSGYSLRALARDLKTSPSFVSEVLNKKKRFPGQWVKPLAKILELDEFALSDLRQAAILECLEGTGLENDLFELKSFAQKSSVKASAYQPLDKKKVSILKKWYYVAVLDLLTCEGIDQDETFLAKKLNLGVAAIREAIEVLQAQKLIEQDSAGRFIKTSTKIRYPTAKTDSTIRDYHLQMLDKARFTLMNKTTDDDFQERLIFGATIAADPKNIAKVKQRLAKVLEEASADLSDGNPTDLMQLNIQLFPLTVI